MAQTTTKTEPAVTDEVKALQESVKNFLLARHFDARGENEFSGVNREYEFHMTIRGDYLSIVVINRFDYESYVDGMTINDGIFANLLEMIGR